MAVDWGINMGLLILTILLIKSILGILLWIWYIKNGLQTHAFQFGYIRGYVYANILLILIFGISLLVKG